MAQRRRLHRAPMEGLLALAGLLSILAPPAALPAAAAPGPGTGPGTGPASGGKIYAPHVPGEVLVKFTGRALRQDKERARAQVGARKLSRLPGGAEHWKLGAGVPAEEAVARLRRDPHVLYAEPNYVVRALAAPDDPLYPALYGLHNTGQTGGKAGADIDAERAWDVGTGSRGVVVGVIDTGIDYNHPDLAANIWTNPGEIPGNLIDDDLNGFVDDVHGYDFANNDPDPIDDEGHGTHVAGTIGAVGNNALGVAGVNWRVSLMALKFLDAGGSGTTAGAIRAVDYATRMGARVTNNSWGGGGFSQALLDAVLAANAAGSLFVAAAGNGGSDNDVAPHYPSSYTAPNIVAVAATDHADALAPFSNFGRTSVDLGAPGISILSTLPGGAYGLNTGTSMATPHVAGTAALVLSRRPGLAVENLKRALIESVDPVPALATRTVSGGRLNALRSLNGPDGVPPGAITDLRVDAATSNTVILGWTATGDDGGAGTAARYDVRYATYPLDEASFDGAPAAAGAPLPGPAGTAEAFEAAGLAPAATYHLALRAVDEWDNRGPISNVVTATTLPPPSAATSPPSLSAALFSGETAERTLTVANVGAGTLDFRVPAPSVGPSSAPEALEPAFFAKGAADPRRGDPPAAGGGAADAFGHRLTDGDAPGGPAFSWVDVAATGTVIASLDGDDQTSEPIPLGFDFEFYGRTYSAVRVSTNGFLSFTSEAAPPDNQPLPSPAAPDTLVAPFWDDLDFGGARRAAYRRDGDAFTVQYTDVPRYGGGGSYTFQVVLAGDGAILFKYLAMSGPVDQATIGVQGPGGGALQAAFNASYARDGLAASIETLPQWLSVRPSSGRLHPGESVDLMVTLDARGLQGGTYQGAVLVETNDPANPSLAHPVELLVTDAPAVEVAPASLDFGRVFAGFGALLPLGVANVGTLPLAVSLTPGDPAVTAGPDRLTLAAGDAATATIAYAPASPGTLAALLVVETDAPNGRRIEIPLSGSAAASPDLEVDPPFFDLTLASEERAVRALRIANPGGSDLQVYLVPELLPAAPPPPGSWVERAKGDDADAGAGAVGPLLHEGSAPGSGYAFRTSDAPGGPVFDWTDLAASGTPLPLKGDDETSEPIPLGFRFPFYGRSFESVRVSTNGWLSFTSAATSHSNPDRLPDAGAATPENLVAPYFDDLDLGGARGCAWQAGGSRFVVQCEAAARSGSGSLAWQAHLHEDGRILFQYSRVDGTLDSGTIGIQDGARARGLLIAWNRPFVHDRMAVEIVPAPRLANGGFEAGDLSGWTAAASPGAAAPWAVASGESGWFAPAAAAEGSFRAVSAFDGEAGSEYVLEQDVAIPAGVPRAVLSYQDRIRFDGSGIPSRRPRLYEGLVLDLDGSLLAVLAREEIHLDGRPYTDLGWRLRSADLTPYAGRTVRIPIRASVPESFTGPASLELDGFRIEAAAVSTWLDVAPRSAVIPPGGFEEFAVTFDSGGGDAADLAGAVRIESNAAAAPVVRVPAALTITGTPDIAISGEPVRVESRQTYVTSGALTHHELLAALPPAGDGVLSLVAEGDFGFPGETASLRGEGIAFGSVGPTGTDCLPASGSFPVAAPVLASLLADGVFEVEVQNSALVDAFCSTNAHTVRLDYAGPSDRLSFGGVFLGSAARRSIVVENHGTDALNISSVTTGDPELVPSVRALSLPPRTSRVISVTFTPAAPGTKATTLTLASNDPDAPVVGVPIEGAGLIPPEIEVAPTSLAASLFTGASTQAVLRVSNQGGSDLAFEVDVEAPQGASVTLDLLGPGGGAAPVLAAGTPVPVALLAGAADRTAGAVDAGAGGPVDAKGGALPAPSGPGVRSPAPALEIFGAPDTRLVAGPRTRGNIFRCTSSRNLIEHRFFLEPGLATQLWFLVYEGAARSGPYVLVSASNATPAGPGAGWYSSGIVDVPLVEGRYYLIAASFEQTSGYYNQQSIAPYPIPASFGELIAAAGWSWAPTAAFPPDPVQSVPAEAFGAPVAYYQALISGTGLSWLAVEPDAGVAPAGLAAGVAVTFDAAGLDGGDYEARIVVRSNDPDEPEVVVPAALRVVGAPDVDLSAASLDFGPVFTGTSASLTLTVANVGTDRLTITEVAADAPEFTVDAASFSLAPRERRNLTVTFSPAAPGAASGTLALAGDDPDEPRVEVALSGAGLLPPVLVAAPASLAETLVSGDAVTRTVTVSNAGGSDLLLRALAADAAGRGDALESVLASLDAASGSITAVIPERFDFSEGEAGISIFDGGGDMYDNGNFLSTDRGAHLPYANGVVSRSPLLGAKGRYFTRKYPGLFVLAADPDGIDEFLISGNLGADGAGAVDGTVLTTRRHGIRYSGFVKRVYNAGDPSVNHLIVVPEAPALAHDFPADTDDDGHRVTGLAGSRRLYYLLYAGRNGRFVDNAAALAVMEAFLDAVLTSPGWLDVEPSALAVPPGGSGDLAVAFDAGGLFAGDYTAAVILESNDPAAPVAAVPVQLQVQGAPDVRLRGRVVAVESVQFYTTDGGATSHSLTLPFPPEGDGAMELIVLGDFGDYYESATAAAEGRTIGSVGFTRMDCVEASGSFPILENDLAAIAADGVVHVEVQNSPDVNVFCAANQHTVRLAYRARSDRLDFGSLYVGQSRTLPLILENAGTDTLVVGSIASDLPDFTVSPSSAVLPPATSLPLAVTFAPASGSDLAATLRIESNDPRSPVLAVPLTGRGVEPPLISVAPASISAVLPSGGAQAFALTVANVGGSRLDFTAQARFTASVVRSPFQGLGAAALEVSDNPPPAAPDDFEDGPARGSGPRRDPESDGPPDPDAGTEAAPGGAVAVLGAPGDFESLPPSPVPLTCIVADPAAGHLYGQANYSTAFYRYSAARNVWEPLAPARISAGNNGGAVILNGKIYTTYTANAGLMGVYDIAGDAWSTIANPLGMGTGNIAGDDRRSLYLVARTSFVRFEPATGSVTRLAPPPFPFSEWGGLRFLDGVLYGHEGNGGTGFASYDVLGGRWRRLPDVPAGAVLGAAVDPLGRAYYAYGSYGGRDLYRYSVDAAAWGAISAPFFSVGDGGLGWLPDPMGIYFVAGEVGTGLARLLTGVPFVRIDPPSGSLAPGESAVLEVLLDAAGQPAGSYAASLAVESNDPFKPVASVPVALEVFGFPDLVVAGEEVAVESARAYIHSGAATAHVLPVTVPPAMGGVLELTVDGDYGDAGETALMSAEGIAFPPVGETTQDCAPAGRSFPVAADDLALLAADGQVLVDVQNSAAVDVFCAGNSHTVRLRYRAASNALAFGPVPFGGAKVMSLELVNAGSDVLHVGSISADLPEFAVSSADFDLAPRAAQVVPVTFAPAAPGSYAGALTILSDDPDAPVRTVQLTGEGTDHPIMSVEPAALLIEAPAGGEGSAEISVLNSGGRPLSFTAAARAQVPEMSAFVLPAAGMIPPGGSARIEVTFGSGNLPVGTYSAAVEVRGDDPIHSAIFVPVTVRLVGVPVMAVLGESVLVQSMKVYAASGATTLHALPAPGPPAGDGTLDLIVEGDFGETGETATATAEGLALGSLGRTGADCAPAAGGFDVHEADLAAVAADGTITVEVRNSASVEASCLVNRHTVRLAYRESAAVQRFGPVFVGASATRRFFVENAGRAELVVGSIASSAPEFGATPASFTVPPGGSQAVTVRFAPAAARPYVEELTIAGDDPQAPEVRLVLEGTGAPPPVLEVDPAALEATVAENGREARTLTISNAGPAPLSVQLSARPAAPAFLKVDPVSGTVPPGGALGVSILFDAAAVRPGNHGGVIAIASNDPLRPALEVPATLHVLGAPAIRVSGDVAVLESSRVYVTPGARTSHRLRTTAAPAADGEIEIVAEGDFGGLTETATAFAETVSVGAVGRAGTDCAAASGTFPLSLLALEGLLADGIAQVDVTNSPDVDANCPVNRHVVRLRYRILPENVDFAPTFVGASRVRSLFVENIGTNLLAVGPIQADLPEVSAAPASFTLVPGASRLVDVAFAPRAAGPVAGTLVLPSSDPGTPEVYVGLTGEGRDPPVLVVSPASLSARVLEGGSAALTLTLENTGAASLDWSLSVRGGGPPFLRLGAASGAVPPGGSTGVAVTLDAAGLPPGIHAAELDLATNDPARAATTVPVELIVVRLPRLAVTGERVRLESARAFAGASARTAHRFVLPAVPAAGGTIEAAAAGDFGDPGEEALVSAEGRVLGAVGPAGADCAEAVGAFPLAAGELAALAADGVVIVEISNASGVDPICPVNAHAARLSYEARSDRLDFGRVFTGHGRTRSLVLENRGGEVLEVGFIAADRPEFVPSAASLSVPPGGAAPLDVVFTPSGAGPVAAALTIRSNDPDAPEVIVPLEAEAAPPPAASVEPGSLEAALPPGGAATRTLRLANAGGSDLVWHVDGAPGDPSGSEYRFRDSASPGGPAFDWVEIEATGTPLPIQGDDLNSGPVPIGFPFPFYGRAYSTVNVSSNGWLSFTNRSAAYRNAASLPSADVGSPENLVAPFWDDLDLSRAAVHALGDGSRFVVQFSRAGRFVPGSELTFQVQLFPSGRIVFLYRSLSGDLGHATIGIQNADRSEGLLVSARESFAASGLAVEIEPPVPAWLQVSPASGSIPPGGEAGIALALSAAGIPDGDHHADVVVLTNDPASPRHVVPVLLHTGWTPLARLSVEPGTLNPASHGRTVRAAFQLPPAHDPREVLLPSVSIEGRLQALPSPAAYADEDGDGVEEVIVKFDRAAFEALFPEGDAIPVTVIGEVRDRTWFRGTDTIRAVRPRLRSPDGGEYLVAGGVATIEWEAPPAAGAVLYDVLLSRDGGETWEPLASGLTGTSHPWTVAGPATARGRVRVFAADARGVMGYDTSDGDVVVAGSLHPPGPLAALEADVDGPDLVLRWAAPAADPAHGPADLYRILAAADPRGPYVEAGTTPASTFRTPLAALPAARTVFLKVRPQNAAGAAAD